MTTPIVAHPSPPAQAPTPGPWTLQRGGKQIGIHAGRPPAWPTPALAVIHLDQQIGGLAGGIDNATCHANAELMAAAPELLAAGQAAEQALAFALDAGTFAGLDDQAADVLTRLHAAIANATGGQP